MALTERDIINFLQRTQTAEETIEPQTELFSSGVLDSVAMMNLIMFVEEKTRVEVHPGDVTLDNFDTVSRIVAYADAQA